MLFRVWITALLLGFSFGAQGDDHAVLPAQQGLGVLGASTNGVGGSSQGGVSRALLGALDELSPEERAELNEFPVEAEFLKLMGAEIEDAPPPRDLPEAQSPPEYENDAPGTYVEDREGKLDSLQPTVPPNFDRFLAEQDQDGRARSAPGETPAAGVAPAKIVNAPRVTNVNESQSQSGSQSQSQTVRNRPKNFWNGLNRLKQAVRRQNFDAPTRQRVERKLEKIERLANTVSKAGKKLRKELKEELSQMDAHRKQKGFVDGPFGTRVPTGAPEGETFSRDALNAVRAGEPSSSSTLQELLSDLNLSPDAQGALLQSFGESGEGVAAGSAKSVGLGPWPEGMPGPTEYVDGQAKERPNVEGFDASPSAGGLFSSAEGAANGGSFDWVTASVRRSARQFLAAWRQLKAGETGTAGARQKAGAGSDGALGAEANLPPGMARGLDAIFEGRQKRGGVLGASLGADGTDTVAYWFALTLAAFVTAAWLAWALGVGPFSRGGGVRKGARWFWFLWGGRRRKKRASVSSPS